VRRQEKDGLLKKKRRNRREKIKGFRFLLEKRKLGKETSRFLLEKRKLGKENLPLSFGKKKVGQRKPVCAQPRSSLPAPRAAWKKTTVRKKI